MVKKKGNLSLAINELSSDKNNAVATVLRPKKLKNGGVLSGAVYTLKDNFATSNHKTEASSKTLRGYQPGYDSDVFRLLKQAGALCVGKTNLDELGMGGTGTLSANGIILHPLDNTRIIGGSSSGSAATFTDAITFAIGSDTGDSIRRPASFIGKVGFKPSYGAVSRYGLFSYASSFDTVSWITHNVHDSISVAKVLFSTSTSDLTTVPVDISNITTRKPKAVSYFNLENLVEPYVWSGFERLLNKLSRKGVTLKRLEPDLNILKVSQIVYQIISFAEGSSNMGSINGIAFGNSTFLNRWEDIYKNTRSNFGSHLKKRIVMGSLFLNLENQREIFLRAQKVRRIVADYMLKILKDCDLLLNPAQVSIAPKLDGEHTRNFVDNILTISNLYGSPSIVMKIGEQDNLPFNIVLETATYEDRSLLSYSLWFEGVINEL